MRMLTTCPHPQATEARLVLSLATTQEEVREVQRLRYKVFIEAMGLSDLVNQDGLDRDAFDEVCTHMLVRDRKTLQVVGTYRVLGPQAAREHGRFYSETEFDLSRLAHLRGTMAEAGRTCIHPHYRGGAVLMLLWSGLAAYSKRERCDHLIGCASVSLADGGYLAAGLYDHLRQSHMAPREYHVVPHHPLQLHPDHPTETIKIPGFVAIRPLARGVRYPMR